MRRWPGALVGGAIVATIVGWHLLVEERFTPFDLNLDFSHEPAVTSLDPAVWEVVPVPHWPGVFELFDRGRPAGVSFDLPAQAAYALRLKVTFRTRDAGVTYALNGTPLGIWTASQVGAAEKRQLSLPADYVKAGRNTITFVSQGPRRAVLYEQVRLRNFRATMWEPHLYLVPKASQPMPRPSPLIIVLGALIGWVIWQGSAWVVAGLGGWPRGRVLRWQVWPWVPVGLGAVALAVVPMVSEYRVTSSPIGYGALLGALWGLGEAPILLVALMTLAARLVRRLVISTGQLVNAGATTVSASFWAIGRASGWALGFLITQVVWRLLQQTARAVWRRACIAWRWFWANQHTIGYLKMAAGCLVLSLISYGIRWPRAAVPLGHAAGIALVIAMVLQAVQALKEEA